MKNCPHCGYENPRQRIFCLECGKRIEKESKLTRVYSGMLWMAGGVALFVADTQYDLQFLKIIPIPYALSLLGIVVFLIGLSYLLPKALVGPTSPEERLAARQRTAKVLLIFGVILLSPFILLAILIVFNI